jgi:Tfp pilus assembly protein PilF
MARHRTDAAVRRLERAVEIAPGYSAAWNDLGTIAYRSKQYPRAEECFRKSLAADPASYSAVPTTRLPIRNSA